MAYVFRRVSGTQESGSTYTVGFYDPDGKWQVESQHKDKEGSDGRNSAAARCSYLNGGLDDTSKKHLSSAAHHLDMIYTKLSAM